MGCKPVIREAPFESLLSLPLRNGLTKPKAQRGSGVKMISMGELFSSDRIGHMPMDRVPVTDKELELSSIVPADLLFARQSLVLEGAGKCCLVREVSEPTVFESHLIRARVDRSKAEPEYLYYFFKSLQGRERIASIVEQVAAAGIRSKDLAKLSVPCPELDFQHRVVGLLSCIDDKIDANIKLNGYLAELAQTIYNDWFRDFGHWGGQMPSHWETGVLGDYVTVKRGGSPRPIQEYLSDEGLRWLKIADVSGISGPYILEIKEHIKEEGLRKTVHLEPGSLVLSNSATPGIPKILSIDTCIHDGWLYFPQSQFTNEWLYCYFLNVRQELVRMANGSVFQNLKTDIVKNFEVIRPDDETLASFQEMVAPLFNLMESCQKENKQLADLRDTLLPKLMSGEIDVSQVDLTQLNSHLA